MLIPKTSPIKATLASRRKGPNRGTSFIAKLLGIALLVYVIGTLTLIYLHQPPSSNSAKLKFIAPRDMLVASYNNKLSDSGESESNNKETVIEAALKRKPISDTIIAHESNLRALLKTWRSNSHNSIKNMESHAMIKAINTLETMQSKLERTIFRTKNLKNGVHTSSNTKEFGRSKATPTPNSISRIRIKTSRTRMQEMIARHRRITLKTDGYLPFHQTIHSPLRSNIIVPIKKARIVLITFTFGSKTINSPHLELFARSAEHCGADVVFLGDAPTFPLSLSGRVRHVPMTWKETVKRIETLVFNGEPLEYLRASHPYKVIDLKPMLGAIFPEVVASYEFWGHVDNDLVLGNVQKFAPAEVLDKSDVISIYGDHGAGPLMVYRNSNFINWLFMKCKTLKQILNNKGGLNFDEWGNNRGFGTEYSITGVISLQNDKAQKYQLIHPNYSPDSPTKDTRTPEAYWPVRWGGFTGEALWDGACNDFEREVRTTGQLKPSSGLPCTCVLSIDQSNFPFRSKVDIIIKTTEINEKSKNNNNQIKFEINDLKELLMCHFEYGKTFANQQLANLDINSRSALLGQDSTPIFWGRFQGISTDANAAHGAAKYRFVIICFVYGLKDITRLNAALWLAQSARLFKTKIVFIGEVGVLNGKVDSTWVELYGAGWEEVANRACAAIQSRVEVQIRKHQQQNQAGRLDESTCGVIKASDPVLKANDLLPLVSVMFPKIVRGFKFWGYTALGNMIGNIDIFLSDVVVKHFDIVTASKHQHERHGLSSRSIVQHGNEILTVVNNVDGVTDAWKWDSQESLTNMLSESEASLYDRHALIDGARNANAAATEQGKSIIVIDSSGNILPRSDMNSPHSCLETLSKFESVVCNVPLGAFLSSP